MVKLGDLQGDPDPDVARISITLHENDPDGFISGMPTGLSENWSDQVDEVEIGGVTTWKRRFTIKARCLLDASPRGAEQRPGYRLDCAHEDRARSAEDQLLRDPRGWGVRLPPYPDGRHQGRDAAVGGPPDSYDYFIKVRFEVLTTNI